MSFGTLPKCCGSKLSWMPSVTIIIRSPSKQGAQKSYWIVSFRTTIIVVWDWENTFKLRKSGLPSSKWGPKRPPQSLMWAIKGLILLHTLLHQITILPGVTRILPIAMGDVINFTVGVTKRLAVTYTRTNKFPTRCPILCISKGTRGKRKRGIRLYKYFCLSREVCHRGE